ncbi:MAG TPA: hypothetical protein VMI31_06305, partial [Fimbriimonadaceae bacterium]|nr:hypothetical protein [Fimbriimonadaceae bacterium]
MDRSHYTKLGAAILIAGGALVIGVGCKSNGSPGAVQAASGNRGDGTQRIDIKRATDPDAANIDLTPKDITVEQLLATKLPGDVKGNLEDYGDKRIGDFEKSTFRLTGTLKSVVKRKDGDFFLVVAGKSGQTAVIEVPDPDLTKGSKLQSQIEATRKAIEDKYHPTDKEKEIDQPATIEGVGF